MLEQFIWMEVGNNQSSDSPVQIINSLIFCWTCGLLNSGFRLVVIWREKVKLTHHWVLLRKALPPFGRDMGKKLRA